MIVNVKTLVFCKKLYEYGDLHVMNEQLREPNNILQLYGCKSENVQM